MECWDLLERGVCVIVVAGGQGVAWLCIGVTGVDVVRGVHVKVAAV